MRDIKLADRMNGLEESATLALSAKVKAMAQKGETVYNLTAGELPCETPEHISEYVATKLEQNKYTPVAGLSELRELIAKNAKEFYGLDWIEQENVIVTAGVKPAIYESLLATINPGDEVIVPKPYWASYKYEVELAGGKFVDVELDETNDLDISKIEQKITNKTKAILLTSPNNPTGTIFSSKKLLELAGALNKTDILVLSDDIYSKLIFSENFKPVGAHGFNNLVILNGFSKSQALTGWRIGYVIAPKNIAKAINKIQSQIIGNASLPAQYAAIEALKTGDQPVMMEALRKNRQILIDKLNSIEEISYNKPEGAFYVFLDLRKITNNTLSWSQNLLLQTGVAVVPGEAFFMPGFARLCFAADEETLIKALDLIKEFVSKG